MSKNYLDQSGLSYFWQKIKAKKQDTLISGINIKTINNSSILGNGDLSIQEGETLPIGTIIEYSGGSNSLPTGYMMCDGSAISRTTYSQLFDIIGTTYGSGDGSTTFNLPNLKGRVAVGFDSSDSDFDTLGESGGEKTHTLTTNELPSHKHTGLAWLGDFNTQPISLNSGSAGGYHLSYGGNTVENQKYNIHTGSTGGGQAHNNLQPYLVVNYIIKVAQTTPTQAQVVDGYSTSTTDSYSANYVNNAFKKETIFSGVGTKASTTGTYVSTTTTKNPLDYDILIVSFTNNGSNVENINVIFTPKVDSDGITIFFGATTEYNAYISFKLKTTGVEHNIRQIRGWSANILYIKKVQGIKIG